MLISLRSLVISAATDTSIVPTGLAAWCVEVYPTTEPWYSMFREVLPAPVSFNWTFTQSNCSSCWPNHVFNQSCIPQLGWSRWQVSPWQPLFYHTTVTDGTLGDRDRSRAMWSIGTSLSLCLCDPGQGWEIHHWYSYSNSQIFWCYWLLIEIFTLI